MVVVYAENMLKLESGAIGEFVSSTMLMALMDTLIDLDVSRLNFPNKLVAKNVTASIYNHVLTSYRWILDGMAFYMTTLVKEYFRWRLKIWMNLQIMMRKMALRYDILYSKLLYILFHRIIFWMKKWYQIVGYDSLALIVS